MLTAGKSCWLKLRESDVGTALKAVVLRSFLISTAFLLPLDFDAPMWGAAHAVAETPDANERLAFEAAKELGTVEAWDAFLANYPSGFHADLARAYVKKLAAPAPTAPPAAASAPPVAVSKAPEQPADERPCADFKKLKSQRSKEPAKIHFINQSGGRVIVQWIDFDGGLKEYGQLEPGAELVQETFLTHPWITAYEEGSCRQMFLPRDGISVARILPEDQLPKAALRTSKTSDDEDDNRAKKPAKPSKATVERRAKAACVDMGMIYLNGKCAPKTKAARDTANKNKNKACPAGTYRNPYGQCQPNETGG